MNLRLLLRSGTLLFIVGSAACGTDSVTPPNQPPAALTAMTDLDRSASVGTVISKGIIVTVNDAQGRPVANAAVALAVTIGNGSVDPRVAITNSLGQATADWTIGTISGQNVVTASVQGVAAQIAFTANADPGPPASIAFSPQNARLPATSDSLRLSAQSLDAFGNSTSPTPTLVVRDPTVASVDASGLVHALTRGAHTYLIATAGARTDSILLTVLATGESPCADAAVPLDLAVGQVVTGVSGAGVCVHASSDGAEYAVVPYFDSSVPSATVPLSVQGLGITAPPVTLGNVIPARRSGMSTPTLVPNDAFEAAMRQRERRELAVRGAALRAARANLIPGSAQRTVTVPAVGTLLKLNVNATDFCDNPDYRTARVVAVTNKAIVVADTSNPAGGFTDAEYRSIGVTFDTLINPTDSAAFGAVTDIDNNGHVILFFTHAVNDLTTAASGSVVLGFFYARDLLPKTGAPGPCTGSNVGEMFYLVVPDTASAITSLKSKATVVSYTNGTVAHEYQHLINASRRLYVNGANGVTEERWLDEGLAHVAEELNFFAASGRSPRSNLTYDATDPKFVGAFNTFEANNFLRYATYLQRTETQSPIGFDASDDDLETRGAIWNFLRFTVDHLPAGEENSFWYKLVNSTTSGVANLTNALGTAPNSLMRDWAISVFMDDIAAGVDPRFQQPSWNLRSALPAYTSLPYQLITRTLANNTAASFTMAGNGVSFLRFSVANGQEALITVSSGGQPLPSTVELSVVRVK